jgi:acetolactate synthase-1/2/3 large subunit
VIQVDINADYLGKFMDVTCGVVADSSAFLDALSEYYHPILAEGRNVREPGATAYDDLTLHADR